MSETLVLRMPRAELLKLRKRRGIAIPAAVLTVGIVLITYVAIEIFHLAKPHRFGAAGSVDNFKAISIVLAQIAGVIAAVMIGAGAATEDLSSGVFRHLVTTGKSRTRLFLARLPGGLALVLLLMTASTALNAVLCHLLAASGPLPTLASIVKQGLWLDLGSAVVFCIALGIGSLLGSRAATIGVLLGVLLVVGPILGHVLPGVGREAFLSVAFQRIAPSVLQDTHDLVPMSLGAAILTIALWVVVPLAAGLWRTRTRDA